MRTIVTAAQTDITLVIMTKAPELLHLVFCAGQMHVRVPISCRSEIHITFPFLLLFLPISCATFQFSRVLEHARR